MSLAESLTEIARERGLGQAEIARRAGANQSTVCRIMSGATPLPRPNALADVARGLGLTPAEFGRLILDSFPADGGEK